MIRTSMVAAGLVASGLAAPGTAAADELDQRAEQVYRTAFAGLCTAEEMGFAEPPQRYTLSYVEGDYDDSPTVQVNLFRFLCGRGAYNEIYAYILADAYGAVVPLAFASPALDIRYVDEVWEQVESIAVTGYTTELVLVNSAFDPATETITATNRWRGLGDAFSNGTWTFRTGKFLLTYYEVDAAYDGEAAPDVVLDLTGAP